MTSTQELEAEAFTVWKRHGERAPEFVSERIRNLAIVKDLTGAERWTEIAAVLDALMHGERR